MLTTLIFLCAQTPVQHELDMIPFEHLINHKVEADKLRQDRMALDLLSFVAGEAMAVQPDASADLNSQIATGWYNLALSGALSGVAAEREDLYSSSIALLGGQMSRGPFHSSDDVVNYLKTYMEPPFDENRESLKVDNAGNGRVLLAYLQPSQREWLHEFFELQKETQTWTALVEAHIFVGGTEWLDENGFAERATPFLNEGTMGVVVDALRDSSQDEMVSPKILVNPGMDGSLSVLTEYSYVEAWEEFVVQPGDVTVLDPTIETIEEGLTMDVRVLQIGADEYGIALSYELTELMQPMETKEVVLGGVTCRTALPRMATTSLESNLVIPEGGGAVYRTTRSGQEEIVLVIQFQRIEVESEN